MTIAAFDAKTGYQVELLEGEKFERFWPHIANMMQKVPHTWENFTLDSVYQRAKRSNLQVWAGGVGRKATLIFFTQIAIHATGKNLEVFWGCGEGGLDKGLDVLDAAMDNFAQVQGCRDILVIGRPGWEKRFAPYGFKKVSITLSRPVTNHSRKN
jgi:hypothetical protein